MARNIEVDGSAQRSRRGANWDTWKGIAIIAVVAIHVSVSIKSFPVGSFNHDFGLGLRQFLNFCVALFFTFSGYFSPDLAFSDRNGVKNYLASRLMKIGFPYIAWTIIHLLIRSPDTFLRPFGFVKAFVTGSGIGIGYFVVVLCCLIVVHPFTCRFRGKCSGWFVAWMPSLVTLGFIYYVRIFHPDFAGAKFPYNALPFTLWFGFFQSGFLLKTNFSKTSVKHLMSSGTAVLLVAVGAALSFLESYLLRKAGMADFAGSQIRVSSFAYSFAVILTVLGSPLGRISIAPIAWLGRNSYSIYLSHLLVLIAVQHVLERFSPIWSNQVLYIPLATTCVILVFSAVHLMLVPELPGSERAR